MIRTVVSRVSFPVRTTAVVQNLVIVSRKYHEKVIDHYENPRNAGSLDKNDKDVGTGLVGAPACGDVMKMQIKVDEETGKVIDAKFKTFGCCSAIASSSFATEWIKGKSLDEASKIKNTVIASELKLPPVKLHCSMLAEDAIKAALKDYQQKKQDKESAVNWFEYKKRNQNWYWMGYKNNTYY